MQHKNELCSCGSGKKYKRCCMKLSPYAHNPKDSFEVKSLKKQLRHLIIEHKATVDLLNILHSNSPEARVIIDRAKQLSKMRG